MGNDYLSYPTDAMKQTARDIRTLLDEQWKQHTGLLHTNSTSLANLTSGLTRGVPGGKVHDVQTQFEQWGKDLSKYYQSLHAIADALDDAADGMTDVEQTLTQSFQNKQQNKY